MNYDFEFCCPTKIYFRNNGIGTIGKIISRDYGFSKVLLVYGGHSLKNSGNYDRIVNSLNENKIGFAEYSGIQANPDIEDVKAMVDIARKFKPDLVLAVGGGSVLDAAKCVANAYYYDGNPLDLNKHVITPLHALPVATIITLSASGSEMSDSAVISSRETGFKGGYNSITNYPLFSLIDPSLLKTVPLYQIGVGLADMYSHSMERYFSASHEFEPCDDLALSIMKSIAEVSPKIISDPKDTEAIRGMLICGSLSHDGFTNYGKGKMFIIHKAEHKLSGLYPELAHGQGIALLMPIYLEKNKTVLKDKIIRMGVTVFGMRKNSSVKSVISRFREWINSLPIAHSFEECNLGIRDNDIKDAVALMKLK